MPAFSAISDLVTDRSPPSATSSAVVSRMASRTSRRCASMARSCPAGCRFASNRTSPVTWNYLGLVPALLDPVQADKSHFDDRLADVHEDVSRYGRRGGR